MQRSDLLRLIRCDGAWKVVPWITLLIAILATVSQKELVWPAYAWGGTCVGIWGSFRTNRFLSSLPFDGRSIFLARFTTAIAFLWCPAIAGTIVRFVSHAWIGAAAGSELLILAGFYTAMFLLAYAIRIEWFHPSDPKPVLFVFFGFAGVLLAWLPVAPTAIVEAQVIALLMIRVWKTVPRSFQLVSRPPRLESTPGLLPALKPTRLLQMRLIWGWHNVWILPVLVILIMGGHNAMGSTIVFMPGVWAMFSGRDRWLRTLPISPRRLLLMFILPVLAAVVGGDYLSLWSSAPSVQMQIVSVAVAAAFTLFQCIFWASVHGHRSARSGLVGLVVTVGLWCVWTTMRGRSFFPVDAWIAALVRASSHVSDFLLLIMAIAILALLYVVLEWVFTGSEHRNTSAFRQEKS